ncbi:twin-arginine translocase TatA/TatE family subunit [Haloplanus rallus]|jgi:sec-independent protein translocase protein TatA|uniref:Sec-independent protein translocase protein TatA n=1 Tax=Haloplanus rallus TaxID=1816183 RepID=A0A6B9FFH2_9EURY|nr:MULTISPECIES: twin-arginine translocase TatA/TatE family subunit [Haloplanus]QGX94513.1 twin-arginine translocase TatA/TatE family subunit [Haloplanus rallus]
MHDPIVPLFPGLPGGPELLIVLFVLVLLFGANKIPKLARSTGQAMGEFKRGREEIEEELQEGADPSSGDSSTTTTEETATADDETEPSTNN